MKNYTIFKTEMTSLEQMMFDRYLSNKGIAMNTMTKEERAQLTEEWVTQKRVS